MYKLSHFRRRTIHYPFCLWPLTNSLFALPFREKGESVEISFVQMRSAASDWSFLTSCCKRYSDFCENIWFTLLLTQKKKLVSSVLREYSTKPSNFIIKKIPTKQNNPTKPRTNVAVNNMTDTYITKATTTLTTLLIPVWIMNIEPLTSYLEEGFLEKNQKCKCWLIFFFQY